MMRRGDKAAVAVGLSALIGLTMAILLPNGACAATPVAANSHLPQRSPARTPRVRADAGTAAAVIGKPPVHPVGLPQTIRRAATAMRAGTAPAKATPAPGATAAGAAGKALAQRPVTPALGGPARYDAKRGAVLGGRQAARRR